MNTIAKLTSAALCGLALTACGGGDSPKPLTFHYETQPNVSSAADLQALLNQEGAKGYFYQPSYMEFVTDGLSFVNDGSGKTYTYEVLNLPDSMTNFLIQANTEGAKGYRYEGGNYISIAIYRKDSGSSATYTYVNKSNPNNDTDFLAQANQQGKSGFLLMENPFIVSTPDILYMRDNASHAIYTYDAPPSPPTATNSFLAQLNAEGAKGYRALGIDYGDAPILYVKDQTQAATFIYRREPSDSASIEQANNYGAQGYAHWGHMDFKLPGYSDDGVFYIKANNCSGWMCTAVNPAPSVGYGSN